MKNPNIQPGLEGEWWLWDGDDWRGPWASYEKALEARDFLVDFGCIPENLM